jgi:hypothetical protein
MGFLDAVTTDDRVQTFHLQDSVPADTEGHEVAVELERDGTLEHLTLWSVPGSEDALEVRPVVRRYNGDRADDIPIPDYGDGEQFVTGEPDGDEYVVNMEVTQGDEIVIQIDNTSLDYAYRFRALPTVDYAGGTSRLLGVF